MKRLAIPAACIRIVVLALAGAFGAGRSTDGSDAPRYAMPTACAYYTYWGDRLPYASTPVARTNARDFYNLREQACATR